MLSVRVLTDSDARTLADSVAERLRADGRTVELRELPSFPIADGLPALLHAQSSRCDLVVVAVARTSPNRAWVLAEIGRPQLYPRVILAVAAKADFPEWAAADRQRVFVATDVLPESLR